MCLSEPDRAHDVHLVPTSHWDREWYLPFEGFRARLLGAMDAVLELLDRHAEYRFTLDGQSILVDDYLELRPERRPALERAVADGRLRVGPWYVQPDELLVCGESLVRNLGVGRARARELGGALLVGYLPDSFGHAADLPEILAGFGIGTAIFARGLDQRAERLGDLFWWQAPSGLRVLAHWMPEGYGPAAGLPQDEAVALGMLEQIRARLAARATGPALLLQAGSDHSRPQAHLPALVAAWAAQHPELPLRFSDHEAFFEAERPAAADRPTVAGELRGSRYHPLLPGVLSSRIYLKLRNFALEGRLLREVEPAVALAGRLAAPDSMPEALPLVDRAWRQLLQNHPHDSICGCSVDAVHREMELRYDRCEQLTDFVVDRAVGQLGAALAPLVPADGGPGGAAVLLAINPEGQRQGSSLAEASLALSRAELAGPLELVAATVGPVQPRPVQLLEQQSALQGVIAGPIEGLPQWIEQLADRHPVRAFTARLDGETLRVEIDEGPPTRAARRLSEELLGLALEGGARRAEIAIHRSEARAVVDLVDLPPLGYAATALQRAPAPPASWGRGGGARAGLEASERRLCNGLVDLELGDDGTLAVCYLPLDWRVEGQHRLADVADRGDSYNHGALVGDQPLAARARAVRLVERGPLRAALEVDYELQLPVALAPDRHARSTERICQRVTTRILLWRDSPRIDFVTCLSNRVEDHRLRVCFPLPPSIAGSPRVVDSAFSVIEREVTTPAAAPAEGEAEAPADAQPLRLFVDVNDGQRGLALLAAGPAEYGCGGGDELCLTLVRAVGWLARDDVAERPGLAGPPYPVPGAQCLDRRLTLRYALLPHAGDHRAASVLEEARRFAFPPLVRVAPDGLGEAPPRGSLATLEPGFLTTALYRDAAGRTICRAVNASARPLPPPAGTPLDLAGAPLDPAPAAIPPWGLITVALPTEAS